MIIGFALERVWGHEPGEVEEALNQAGCQRIILAKAGTHFALLDSVVRRLKRGDIFIVDTLASLSDSMQGLLEQVDDFYRRGICLRSLCEKFDSHDAIHRHPVTSVAQISDLERKFQR